MIFMTTQKGAPYSFSSAIGVTLIVMHKDMCSPLMKLEKSAPRPTRLLNTLHTKESLSKRSHTHTYANTLYAHIQTSNQNSAVIYLWSYEFLIVWFIQNKPK